jgi:exosome complex exonuclease DIS3/RRP44
MLINNPQEVFNKKIMIKLKEWPINSGQPIGTFLQIIGEIGHMDTESKVILLEHNVEFRPFSKQVLDCLPLDNY